MSGSWLCFGKEQFLSIKRTKQLFDKIESFQVWLTLKYFLQLFLKYFLFQII